MRNHLNCGAALQVAIVGLLLVGTVLLYGCAVPAVQVASPGATTPTTGATAPSTAVGAAGATPTAITATGQQLAGLGCVCHIQGEEGAPPVSQVAALSADTITQAVRQGRSPMPAWNTQNLSDQWLTDIIDSLKSGQQGTPSPVASRLD